MKDQELTVVTVCNYMDKEAVLSDLRERTGIPFSDQKGGIVPCYVKETNQNIIVATTKAVYRQFLGEPQTNLDHYWFKD